MKRVAKSSAGFTLVELLVVIGITGLVLAVVVSTRPKATAVRLAAAARSVAVTLQMARAQAMASNTETVVRIDAQKRQFGFASSMQPLPKGVSVALTVAATERVGESGGLRFYPDGQSTGGEIVLTLGGRSSRVAVNWLTGEARLSP
jgi:general secretion pathway protein H